MGTGPTLAAPAHTVREDLGKAAQLDQPAGTPKSLLWDPFAIVDALGYKDRPSAISYNTMGALLWRVPVVRGIIQTRIGQVSQFARVAPDRYSVGYRVMLRDQGAQGTAASRKRARDIERWILTTGTTDNAGNRESFRTYLKKITQDSLTYDATATEIIPARNGKPAQFQAVDPRTVRIADTTKLYIPEDDEKVVRWVQIYDGLVVNEYNANEMFYGIRNPNSDIRLQGYGTSELEMLVSTVTSFLWAFDYNSRAFSQGAMAKGIINLKGTVPDKQMREFKDHWYNMLTGVESAFKTPIMNSDELQYISLQNTNRDMEYNAFMDFLIKIIAAIYGMDPMEVNFKYGDGGEGKSMFESNNNAKLTASKDKGLRTFLDFTEDMLNTAMIHRIDEDFELRFVGLDSQSRDEQADLDTKLVKSTRTINELRARDDEEPLPNGMGDIILDPVFMQHMTMAQQQHAQDFHGEGGDGDGGGEPGEDPEAVDGEDLETAGEDDGEDAGPPPKDNGPVPPAKPAKAAKPAAGEPVEKSMRAVRPKPITIRVEV